MLVSATIVTNLRWILDVVLSRQAKPGTTIKKLTNKNQ
jgi:hypothetical protein